MPCRACKQNFLILPCKHPNGVEIADEKHENFLKSSHSILNNVKNSETYLRFIKHCFKELHFNCFCRNCMIKSICNETFDNRCSEYKQLIDKIHKIYYDPILAQFRPEHELRKQQWGYVWPPFE